MCRAVFFFLRDIVTEKFRSFVPVLVLKLAVTVSSSPYQWFLTFFPPRLPSNCPLFQASLTLNKLQKQMYLLVNLIKNQTFHVAGRVMARAPLEIY